MATLRGGSTEVGLLNAARWVPYLLFGIVVGVLVDRMRRRPLLIATDLARGLLLLGVPILAAAGSLTLTALLLLVAGFGLFSLVGDAAFQSFVPRVVPGHLLTPAHARLDQSDAVAQTSGPAIAGALISWVGAPVAVLVDAGSYLLSAIFVTRVGVEEPAPTSSSLRGIRSEGLEGLRWVYRKGTLQALAVNTHAWFLCSAVAGAVVTPFALQTLGLGPLGLGLAMAAAGVGGVLGSSVTVRLGVRWGAGKVVVGTRALTALAWGVMSLATSHPWGWVPFAAGQLLFGFSLGAQNSHEMGYRQSVTPDRLQARMNTTMRSINRTMIVIGAPIGGLLGDRFGFRPLLVAAAVGFAVVALTLALSPFQTVRLGSDAGERDPHRENRRTPPKRSTNRESS